MSGAARWRWQAQSSASVRAAGAAGSGARSSRCATNGYDIAEVLAATVDEALTVFRGVRQIAARLQRLSDVGLGYLPLGRPATTISGGEAQRLKLAKELGRRATGRTLYLLDEPTTGLHAADTARLLDVLQRLVDAGHSIVTIEHHVDAMRASDWIIDLGPMGGAGEGRWWPRGHLSRSRGRRQRRTGRFPDGWVSARVRAPCLSPMSEPHV